MQDFCSNSSTLPYCYPSSRAVADSGSGSSSLARLDAREHFKGGLGFGRSHGQLKLCHLALVLEVRVQQCSALRDINGITESEEGPTDDRHQRSKASNNPEIGQRHVDVISEGTCGGRRISYMSYLRGHGVVQTNQIRLQKPDANPVAPLYKMLTAHPNICPKSQELPHDVDEANDVYRILSRNRRNLVLDSVCPDLTPHIVITPPVDSRDEHLSRNCIAPQWPGYLMVPPLPLYLDSVRSPTHWLSSNEFSDSKLGECSSSPVEVISDRAKRLSCPSRAVFSRSKFAKVIEQSSSERLILYHVVTALYRHQRKACAFDASILALSFRSQYASPNFVWKVEKPFSWTDAAEPLLLMCRYRWGTTIIDSACPLTAPHIIISEAPPPNPWVRWQNATADPQDHGHGRYLTVPSRSVEFVNEPDYNAALIHPGAADFSDESPPETPLPGTPPPTRKDNQLGCDGDMSSKDSSGELSSNYVDEHLSHDPAYAANVTHPFADEGNDLPPFDAWYTSVVERMEARV